MAMTVKKNDNEVRIQWRVADIKIPNNEIKISHKTKISMQYLKKWKNLSYWFYIWKNKRNYRY